MLVATYPNGQKEKLRMGVIIMEDEKIVDAQQIPEVDDSEDNDDEEFDDDDNFDTEGFLDDDSEDDDADDDDTEDDDDDAEELFRQNPLRAIFVRQEEILELLKDGS